MSRTKTRGSGLLLLLALVAIVGVFTIGPLSLEQLVGPRAVELEAFWNPGQSATVIWAIDADGNTERPNSSGHFYAYRREWAGGALLDVQGIGHHSFGVTCILRSNGQELTRDGGEPDKNHCRVIWPRGR